MSYCEDYPCCGHEPGCCPDFDPKTGKQLNMKCVCGATVPLNSKSSLCKACLFGPDPEDPEDLYGCDPYSNPFDDGYDIF